MDIKHKKGPASVPRNMIAAEQDYYTVWVIHGFRSHLTYCCHPALRRGAVLLDADAAPEIPPRLAPHIHRLFHRSHLPLPGYTRPVLLVIGDEKAAPSVYS